MDFLNEKTTLSKLISEKRFNHSCRVAEVSRNIAKTCNYDSNRAYLTGLLHDCAKNISINDTRFHFSEDEVNLFNDFPAIWHSLILKKVGMFFFPDAHDDVFDAARFHSTGSKNMTVLAKIVFVADYIEPERSYIQDNTLFDLAVKNLDNIVLEVSRLKLIYLLNNKQKIHHYLFECYDFYNN